VCEGTARIEQAIARHQQGALIADATTDEDLASLAQAAVNSRLRVVAGSAGLARQLAFLIGLSGPATSADSVPDLGGALLFVAASQHAATVAQVDALEAAGVAVVIP